MVKVHKLVAAIAATIALSSTSAYALNIGQISWKSSFGQPLNATIELTDTEGLKAADVRATLSSIADFDKAGIDRPAALSHLVFKPVITGNKGYIQVTSTAPIKEPYLNFLVDVSWKSGQISKEYTILMDLPTDGGKKATTNTVATPPTSNPPANKLPEKEATKPTVTTPTATAEAETYRTVRGDTLWTIAAKFQNTATASQTAAAIYKKNPKAFINGNATQLLADYTLKIPTSQEVRAISIADANTFINSTKVPATAATQPDQTTATKAPEKVEDKKLQAQLQSTEIQLDTARQENDNLSNKLEDLQAEIEKLEQISKEKDSQIADIKTQLEAIPAVPEENKGVTTTPEENKGVTTTPEENKGVTTTPEENKDVTTTPEENKDVTTTPEENKDVTTTPEENKGVTTTPEENKGVTTVPQQNKVTPPVVQPEFEEPSLLALLQENTMFLAMGGGVLLLACVALLVLRRRKAAKEDDATEIDLSQYLDDDESETASSTVAPTPDSADDGLDSPLANLDDGASVIDKADIYLAYNRYNEAKDLLINALDTDPINTEYRLKLMEVYAEKGDWDNFIAAEQELMLIDPMAQSKVDSLRHRYPALMSASNISFTPHTETTVDAATSQQPEPIISSPSFDDDDQSFEATLISEPVRNEQDQTEETPFDFGSYAAPTEITEETLDSSDKAFDLTNFDNFSLESEPQKTVDEEKPAISEPDPIRKVDDSFELDTIAQDVSDSSTSIFGSDGDTLEEFGSNDSPIFEFAQEEQPEEEIKEENFKFDLNGDDNSHFAFDESISSHLVEPENIDSDFDPIIEKDQVTTKLELVQAYIDMGDAEGAHDLLDEVMNEGNDAQKAEAQRLLSSLGDIHQIATTSTYTSSATTELEQPILSSEPTLETVTSSMLDLDLGFELPAEDEVSTKLELARAYIDMGDNSGARDILDEILKEGTSEQIKEAEQLIANLK